MLTKLENPEIMTVEEARQKYKDHWFRYDYLESEEEREDIRERDLVVKITHIADLERDFLELPKRERYTRDRNNGWGINIHPEPVLCVGGFEIVTIQWLNDDYLKD